MESSTYKIQKMNMKKGPRKHFMEKLLFFLWDGMEFFGFDLKKVQRLDGRTKAKWSDSFTSAEALVMIVATSAVFSIVTFYEGSYWWFQ